MKRTLGASPPGGGVGGSGGPGTGLFPLPRPGWTEGHGKISRRCSQRQSRRKVEFNYFRGGVDFLNWMAGHSPPTVSSFSPSGLQLETLERVRALARSTVEAEASFLPALSGEAAIRALLQGGSEYEELPSTLASFCRERVSLPDDLHDCPKVMDLLPEDAHRFLEAPERILREAPEDCDITPYWDPVLRGSAKEYRKFIQRLHGIGYLDFTLEPCERAGAFVVKKSDGVKQRLIIDGRRANSKLATPPSVRLCTPEAFSRIEFELADTFAEDNFEALSQRIGLHVGVSDVRDCFHRLIQPRWLGRYFCLDPIPVRWIMREGGIVEGIKVSPDDLIFPFPRPLCMGCSWSLPRLRMRL